jgi:hypothetical protein
MSLTYTTYRLQLQTLVASQDPDPDFDNILPGGIDYAEQRIYRTLNLLNTVQTDDTTTLTPSQRAVAIPTSFVAVNTVNVITPAGAGSVLGVRNPLVPVSRDLLDVLWPDNTTTGVPSMFCMVDQWSMLVAPAPDDDYALEITGTYRPDPLSATNTTTFLTERLPDLFIAASMVYMSGYMRNFGAQAGDPAMGASWEQQYNSLLQSADTEEARKHFWASSWSSQPVSPAAQPQRG